jgi:tryptophanyl-tRNA synthetase
VKGEVVPVGRDQEAHLEQSREIARTFNTIALANGKESIFPEPKALIGREGKLIGTDGNPKMSKSLGNTIFLSATTEEVKEKVMGMYTDPKRIHATDPGTVEGNPLFIYLDNFSTEADAGQIGKYKELYRAGKVGDVEVKKYLIQILENFLTPIREKRKEYDNKEKLLTILRSGTERVREETKKTLEEVKSVLKFVYTTPL